MNLRDSLEFFGHEQVTVCRDPSVGYMGVLAVHSTVLGPAVGGTRVWSYASMDDALTDALRLSRGMTYKNALAGLPFGGGKAVVLGPAPTETAARESFFRAHGRFVERLGGLFVTAEDVGTSPLDMALVAQETHHVAGLDGGMGDPSPFTARGVLRAMEAVAVEAWGTPGLRGRTVAVQGLGNVGTHLAQALHDRGVRLVVTDVLPERVRQAVDAWGAKAVAPDEILDAEADIFAPCALGGILDDDAVDRLSAQAVCGGANNQLLEAGHGDRLAERGILYVPDYVANAGGVISGTVDIAGWDRSRMEQALEAIFDTVREVFDTSSRMGVGPHEAADAMAEQRLARPTSCSPRPRESDSHLD